MSRSNRRKRRGEIQRTQHPLGATDLMVRPNKQDEFLHFFEETCGNVSATCELINIDRGTFYNWQKGERPEDIVFQQRIREIRADERFIDVAEATLLQKIREGDVPSTIFTLKTKGRHRGWSERETLTIASDLLDRVALAYQAWLNDHKEATLGDKLFWLGRFAANGGVEKQQLAKKVGVEI